MTFTTILDAEGQPLNNVWSIIEDKYNTIWLANINGVYRTTETLLKRVSPKGGGRLYSANNGNVWFTYNNGISYFSNAVLQHDKPVVTDVFENLDMLFGITEDKNGTMWFGNLRGVLNYDGQTVNFFNASNSN